MCTGPAVVLGILVEAAMSGWEEQWAEIPASAVKLLSLFNQPDIHGSILLQNLQFPRFMERPDHPFTQGTEIVENNFHSLFKAFLV